MTERARARRPDPGSSPNSGSAPSDQLADRAAPDTPPESPRPSWQRRLPRAGEAGRCARRAPAWTVSRHEQIRPELTERPTAVPASEHSPVGQRRDQLLGEKRVPPPPVPRPARGSGRGSRCPAAQGPAAPPPRPAAPTSRAAMPRPAGPSPAADQAAPAAPSLSAATARPPARRASAELTQLVTGPVQVLDQHRGLPLGGQLLQETHPRRPQPFPPRSAGGMPCGGARPS